VNPRWVLRWSVRAVVLAVVAIFIYLVISVIQVLTASQVSQLPASVETAAAIVVMSPPGGSGKLSTDLVNRLEQALSLYEAHKATIVVVTGANGATGLSDPVSVQGVPAASTEVGAEIRFLEQEGMLPTHIYQAGGTDDTSGLAGVKTVVGKTDGGRVIIVADPLSSLRLRATAAADGLVPEISPGTPPSAGFMSDVGQVWKQASAVALGRVLGFSSTGWAST
jgi:hypothetical protein